MNNSPILRYSTLTVLLFSLFQIGGCQTNHLEESKAPVSGATVSSYKAQSFHGQPKQIALLLPAGGNLAESSTAIREGFFASYYESSHLGAKPNVRLYDTSKGNVQNIYQQAMDDGADLVVGPLAKEEVRQLSMMPASQMKTPVLALNSHPGASRASSLMQFSLAPETEAEQIAERAKAQGYQSAGIIVPNNVWGRRIASAFTAQWQRQGGTIKNTVYSNPTEDQSAAVRRLLAVKEPQPGKHRSKDPMHDKPQISMDFIVMAAHPDQARQIKPLLGFYYADNIPVLATSSVYSGSPNPGRDNDLNGVIFCDMACMINQQHATELQRLLAKHGTKQSNQYNRLFAMGVDAYQLSTRLNHLQNHGRYPGATGILSIRDNNELERQLQWAQFRGGVPTPL